MLDALLWTIPSLISVGVFLGVVLGSITDLAVAQQEHPITPIDIQLNRQTRIVATERLLTALGGLALSLFAAVVGLVALVLPRNHLAGEVVVWLLLALPWVLLGIGVNILIGRRKVQDVPRQ